MVGRQTGGRRAWETTLTHGTRPCVCRHAHTQHGAVTIQAFSANGLVVVEDDPRWLPDANGCKPLRSAME